MNYFDIRKLQSSLSMIRVALLHSDLDLGKIDLQTYLANMPSSVISPDDFASGNINLELLINALSSNPITLALNSYELSIKKSLMEIINSGFADSEINIYNVIKKALLEARPSGSIGLKDEFKIPYEKIESYIFNSLHAEFGEEEFVSPIKLSDIVTLVWESNHPESSSILTAGDLSNIVADAVNSIYHGECKTVAILDCPDIDTVVYKSIRSETQEYQEMVKLSAAISQTVAGFGMQSSGITTKIIALDDLVAQAISSTIMEINLCEYSPDVNVIANLVRTSKLITSLDLAFSMKDTLMTAVTLGLFSQLGINGAFAIEAGNGTSNQIKVSPVNIPDLISKISVAYDLPASMNGGIDFALNIMAKAEIQEKESVVIMPDETIEGATICVYVNNYEAISLVATLKSLFGAKVQAHAASSGVNAIGDTEVNVGLDARVATFASKLLELNLSINPEVKARVGLNIIKTIGDYVDLFMENLNEKTIGELCIEEK